MGPLGVARCTCHGLGPLKGETQARRRRRPIGSPTSKQRYKQRSYSQSIFMEAAKMNENSKLPVCCLLLADDAYYVWRSQNGIWTGGDRDMAMWAAQPVFLSLATRNARRARSEREKIAETVLHYIPITRRSHTWCMKYLISADFIINESSFRDARVRARVRLNDRLSTSAPSTCAPFQCKHEHWGNK